MQFFNKTIHNTDFSFKRVFYGADLWYHITFTENKNSIEFRMYKDEQSIWKIAALVLPIKIHELEMDFGDAIIKNKESN